MKFILCIFSMLLFLPILTFANSIESKVVQNSNQERIIKKIEKIDKKLYKLYKENPQRVIKLWKKIEVYTTNLDKDSEKYLVLEQIASLIDWYRLRLQMEKCWESIILDIEEGRDGKDSFEKCHLFQF